MSVRWIVWGRKTLAGRATRLEEITRPDRESALRDATRDHHRLWPVINVLAVVSWEAMAPSTQRNFVGGPDPLKPVRVADCADGTRRIACRICHQPIVFTKDAEGNWPERYPTYHPGECAAIYRSRRSAMRVKRRREP